MFSRLYAIYYSLFLHGKPFVISVRVFPLKNTVLKCTRARTYATQPPIHEPTHHPPTSYATAAHTRIHICTRTRTLPINQYFRKPTVQIVMYLGKKTFGLLLVVININVLKFFNADLMSSSSRLQFLQLTIWDSFSAYNLKSASYLVLTKVYYYFQFCQHDLPITILV